MSGLNVNEERRRRQEGGRVRLRGAGPDCDGQLLVWSDWAGFTRGRIPKFVKQYARVADTLLAAAKEFREDVESGVYPAREHEYGE